MGFRYNKNRRNLLLYAASERGYKKQYWIETGALPRHDTIRPISCTDTTRFAWVSDDISASPLLID